MAAYTPQRTTRLAGRSGIVVGAGQTAGETVGNGRATALVLAAAGAHVLAVDRDEASAHDTVRLIREQGGTAEAFCADWTDAAQCHAYAQRCLALWGRVDFLHNNVGILSGDGDAGSVALGVFERIQRVNLTGCLLSCQAVLPAMREQHAGSIVNISALAAIAPAGMAAYAISKAAMNALGRELAIGEARHGIRVNTVQPGLIDTPMVIEVKARELGRERASLRAERDARVPLRGAMGTAWDVAHASLFLHSDDARFITAAVLPVDGGQAALVGGLVSFL